MPYLSLALQFSSPLPYLAMENTLHIQGNLGSLGTLDMQDILDSHGMAYFYTYKIGLSQSYPYTSPFYLLPQHRPKATIQSTLPFCCRRIFRYGMQSIDPWSYKDNEPQQSPSS